MAPNKKSKYRSNRQRRAMSRRARRLLYFAAALVLTALFIADRVGVLPAPAGSDREVYHNQSFTVIKVVDGDTIDLDRPDGDKAYTRVRLWGLDTPETKHPRRGVMYYGPEAADFTKKMVLNKKVTIMLEPLEDSRDKYGRLLAYVYLCDEIPAEDPNSIGGQDHNSDYESPFISTGKMLNEELIRQGYAYADERFRHVYKEKFLFLQKQARRVKRGLWKDVQPAQWPEWYRKRHDPDYP